MYKYLTMKSIINTYTMNISTNASIFLMTIPLYKMCITSWGGKNCVFRSSLSFYKKGEYFTNKSDALLLLGTKYLLTFPVIPKSLFFKSSVEEPILSR